jgi:hypothetical protein
MVDLPEARARSILEAQLLLSDLLDSLQLSGLRAAGHVSPRPGLSQAARLVAAEQQAGALAVIAPRRFLILRTLVARLTIRVASPSTRWIGVWPALPATAARETRT